MPLSLKIVAARIGRRLPLFLYLLSVLLIAVAVTEAFLAASGWQPEELPLWLLALPFLLCATHLAIGVAHWLATLWVPPRPLPRLDFSEGIPPEYRTFVVVPTMLSNPQAVEELLEGLELRYLANRDDNLHFALLTDFEDAAQEVMPGDENLLRLAREGIEQLNQKYNHRSDIFFLFHRPRRWNAQLGVWMGYERKRGKLMEFNALLRGKGNRFAEVVGDTARLAEVRYVITLDTDTQLPRDAARTMVGVMAHILNRPVLDARRAASSPAMAFCSRASA